MAKDDSAAHHNYYFDVLALHLYSDPRSLYKVTTAYKQMMAKYQIDKPLWIAETSVAVEETNSANRPAYACTEQEQADFVLQAFSLGLAGGAERIQIYKAVDSPKGEGELSPLERSGLVREDGSKRPAFTAFQVAKKHFQTVEKAAYFQQGNVEWVQLNYPGGKISQVLWNNGREPAYFTVTSKLPKLVATDALGNDHQLQRQPNGTYRVLLQPATCRSDPGSPNRAVVGGPTVIVRDQ